MKVSLRTDYLRQLFFEPEYSEYFAGELFINEVSTVMQLYSKHFLNASVCCFSMTDVTSFDVFKFYYALLIGFFLIFIDLKPRSTYIRVLSSLILLRITRFSSRFPNSMHLLLPFSGDGSRNVLR
jgi:hypothetical protein